MGKWWKCRACGFYNQKHHHTCGWCKDQFLALVDQQQSSKDQPISSTEVSLPKGKGKGKGKGPGSAKHGVSGDASPKTPAQPNGKGTASPPKTNFWQRRAQAAAAAPTSPMVVDAEAEEEADSIMDQMQVTQALINSLKGRSDSFSTHKREQLEEELKQLRIRKTKLKPTEDQWEVLSALVQRKQAAVESTSTALVNAQNAAMEAQQALRDAQCQLKLVADRMEQEKKQQQAGVASEVTTIQKAQSLADMLPKDKAETFRECLLLLQSLMGNEVVPTQVQPQLQIEIKGGMCQDGPLGQSQSSQQWPLSPSVPVLEQAIHQGVQSHRPAPSTPLARYDPYGASTPIVETPARPRAHSADLAAARSSYFSEARTAFSREVRCAENQE